MNIHTLLVWLLYSSLVAYPFGNIFRVDTGLGVGLVPLDVLVGLVFLMSLPVHATQIRKLFKDPLVMSASVFVLVGLISLAMNSSWLSPIQMGISALYAGRFLSYVNLIWVVRMLTKKQRHSLLIGLALSSVVMLAFGLLQFFLYPDLRNLYYLGWDEHLYRLFGTALDPNFTGALFVCSIGVLEYLKLLYRRYTKPIIWTGAVLACSVALTYSRSSLIMLSVSTATYVLLKRSQNRLMYLTLGVLIVAGVLTASQNGESVNLLRTASIHARVTEYKEALEIIQDSPLVGIGLNAYRYAQLQRGFIDLESWMFDHAGAGVPNSYLFVLATSGIIGFIAYSRFWWIYIKQLFMRKDFILLAVIAGLLIHALFENSLFYPYIMYCVFILKGYSDMQTA